MAAVGSGASGHMVFSALGTGSAAATTKLVGSFLSGTVLCLDPQSSYLLCGLLSILLMSFMSTYCQADRWLFKCIGKPIVFFPLCFGDCFVLQGNDLDTKSTQVCIVTLFRILINLG